MSKATTPVGSVDEGTAIKVPTNQVVIMSVGQARYLLSCLSEAVVDSRVHGTLLGHGVEIEFEEDDDDDE
jgi:hypothetical protein